ncbi:MAG: SurA N-terminal domain-containing protein [Fidelibacterota bacterium]
MAIISTIRNRMHIMLWALLILFLLSMTVGGLVGGANILDQLLGKVDPTKAIGMVNGDVISPTEFSNLVTRQIDQLRSAGQEVTDQDIDRIREQVWEGYIRDILVAQALEEMGISATDEEVLYHLRNAPPSFLQQEPVFQTDGQFDLEKYQQAINNPVGNEWAEIEQFMKKSYIPNYKLQQLLFSTVNVSEKELWEEYKKSYLDYTISALHITTRTVQDSVEAPTEEELRAEYQRRHDEFARDELRNLKVVSWKKVPSHEDTLRVEEEARRLLELAQQEGSDFATLANTYTQDPGNQVTPDSGRGGMLGWFRKGQMVKPFEEAAFAAAPGTVVGPVLSPFGYHIIKVFDRREQKGVEEVKAAHILLKIELGASTRERLRRAATLFTYDAQDYGFKAALDTHQVAAFPADHLTKTTLFLPQVGSFRDAVRFAFNSSLGDISGPLENDNYFIVCKLDSILEAGYRGFEEVRDQLRREVLDQRQRVKAKELASVYRQRVEAGSTFEDIKKENAQVEYLPQDTKKLSRGFNTIGRSSYLIGALLGSEPGALIGPVETARGYAIVKFLSVASIDSSDFEAKKLTILQRLQSTKGNTVFENWLQDRREAAEIIDNRNYYF